MCMRSYAREKPSMLSRHPPEGKDRETPSPITQQAIQEALKRRHDLFLQQTKHCISPEKRNSAR